MTSWWSYLLAQPEPDPPGPPPAPPPTAPVVLAVTDELDLHSFRPKDVKSAVEEYLREAQARGFRVVRLVHGRGTGVQRANVRNQLAQHPLVESFEDAPPHLGGWGATIARLLPPVHP